MIELGNKYRGWLISLGAICVLFLMWYFRGLVSYIAVSVIISLIGRPLVRGLCRLRVKNFSLGQGGSAFITLLSFWVVVVGAVRFFIPLLISEFEELSSVNPDSVFAIVDEPLVRFMSFIGHEPVDSGKQLFMEVFQNQFKDGLGIEHVSNLLGTVAGAFGSLLLGAFSVSFISFFFLKEETLFKDVILILTPTGWEERVARMMHSIHLLLRRYFLGLIAEVVLVGLFVTIGLTITGLGFSHAVVIGIFCGLFNVIPYLGPWMGAAVGLLIGLTVNIHADFSSHTLPLLGLMVLVFASVQIIDNILFQPLIYSSSVKAHPLEIFLVIMAAGGFAGIVGMILAIPVYTILRVAAKEFFNEMKLVKKLTKSL
ncbi:AI-2E family transporter [Mangrovibacterium marinum]|uniref:Putative PurR-regulated permease PerM n=1 Tax=Mangrovibacterium marinum TaxID=1639118 RepID=A0A2T5C2B7_9BACT|nr:AI-2E family transporter [Mangrovibacterium marinum]PTN08842.1 putative PurR-regulated permease PerM [Mangrovibacterium marinum]